MIAADNSERHSIALDAEIITDPVARAAAEARNGLRQYDLVAQMVGEALLGGRPFRLRPSAALALNRAALEGIHSFAGNYRPSVVTIGGSKHTPPLAALVPALVEEMCDYVNDNWQQQSASHLSAYVMWRVNWIHPFPDGNGRTARALSYLVLCVRAGALLPGSNTVPEQIAQKKTPYYAALEAADAAIEKGKIDLSVLEELLARLLANQLLTVHGLATGGHVQPLA